MKKRGTTPGAHLQNLQGSEVEGEGEADYFCNCLDDPPTHLLCYDENLVNENNGIRIVGEITLLDMSLKPMHNPFRSENCARKASTLNLLAQ